MWPGEDRAVREWYRIYIVDNDGDAASNSCAALKAQEGAGGLDLRLAPDSNDGGGSALVPILSEPAPTDMYVHTAITGGTAVAGRDYNASLRGLKIGGTERTSVSRQARFPAIYRKQRINVFAGAVGTRTIEFTLTGNYWMKASQFPELTGTLTVTLDELRNLPAPTASGAPHAQLFASPQQESPTGYVVPGYNPPQGQGGGAGQTGKQLPEPVGDSCCGEEHSGQQQQQGDPASGEKDPIPQNSAPTVASPIADIGGIEAGASKQVSLQGVFADGDGDALTLSAASSDSAVVTVSVAADQAGLTVRAVSAGDATITVTARDSDGNQVSDTFGVTVVDPPEPEPRPELPEVVARYDADGDGVISLSEYRAAVAGLGDGLTLDYLIRIRQAWVDGGYQQ
jgi:hypothetical protein